jgi:hypothetical protein
VSKDFDARTEVEIPLTFPVTFDGLTYSKLTMRRPKTKDGIVTSKLKGVTEAERGIHLLARLCTSNGQGVSPDLIAELDETDAEALGDQYKAFTGRQSNE